MMMLLATAANTGGSSWLEQILQWADAESTGGLILVVFGLLAQALFFGRWVVQVIATEKRQESHVPEVFWWMSLVGASMLFVYFTLRREPVGMLGQSIGWTVYLRNLYHIHRKKKTPAEHLPTNDDEA